MSNGAVMMVLVTILALGTLGYLFFSMVKGIRNERAPKQRAEKWQLPGTPLILQG